MKKRIVTAVTVLAMGFGITVSAEAVTPGQLMEKMLKDKINEKNSSTVPSGVPFPGNAAKNSNSSPSSSSSSVPQENNVTERIKEAADGIKNYESEVSLEAKSGEGSAEPFSLTLYLKDKRIYKGKDVGTAHIFIQSNNEKDEMITSDFLVRDGKVYQFDGSSYNLMGNIGSYDFETDSNYWNILKPLTEEPQSFTETQNGTDVILSFNGKSKRIMDLLAIPLGYEGGEGISESQGNIIYTFDKDSLYLKSLIAEITAPDGTETEIKAFYQSINQTESIELPEGVEIKE